MTRPTPETTAQRMDAIEDAVERATGENARCDEHCAACDDDVCEIRKTHPRALELARLHEADDETSLRLAEVFKVLGDRTRIKLLSLLAHKEELCVCDIAEALGMGQSAISHQLRVLRGARLVKYRKEGKEAFYSLDDDHVVTLMQQGLDHVLHG